MLRYSAIQGSRCLWRPLPPAFSALYWRIRRELVDPAAELVQGLDHRLDPLRVRPNSSKRRTARRRRRPNRRQAVRRWAESRDLLVAML